MLFLLYFSLTYGEHICDFSGDIYERQIPNATGPQDGLLLNDPNKGTCDLWQDLS